MGIHGRPIVCEGVEQFCLDQDTGRWRALVNMVMNLRTQYEPQHILSSLHKSSVYAWISWSMAPSRFHSLVHKAL
jgi:hypothetical protein